MRRAIIVAALLTSGVAQANTYLPEPDAAAALTRDQTQTFVMNPATATPINQLPGFWGLVVCAVPINGTTFFIEIEDGPRPGLPGNDFSANPHPVSVVDGSIVYGSPTGLSDAEKGALVPYATLHAGGCWPLPPSP